MKLFFYLALVLTELLTPSLARSRPSSALVLQDIPVAGPVITALSVSHGLIGSAITITGANLLGATTIGFGTGASAVPTATTATTIQVTVPTGAVSGNLTVTAQGTLSNALPFTVDPSAPTIASITPSTGPVGTKITITGANLMGNTVVHFSGSTATPITSSANTLDVVVPAGTTTGPVTVATAGGTSTPLPFTIAAAVPITAAAIRTTVREELETFSASNEKDEVLAVHFVNHTLRTFNKSGSTIDNVTLDSAEFDVLAGRITQLYTYTHTSSQTLKVFTNARTSVSLMRYDRHRDDMLGIYTGKDEYISIGDLYFVIYTSGRRYMPSDGHHMMRWKTATPNPNVVHLMAGASLVSLVEASLYTDLLGLLRQEPNSLVSLELTTQIPLNTEPIRPNWKLYLFQFIRPYGSYSRLDSKVDTVHLRGSNFDYVDRADLLQRAYLRYGANLNILSINARSPHNFMLNAGWSGGITQVTNGVKNTNGDVIYRNAYTKTWNIEGLASFRRLGNFGVDIGANLFFSHIANGKLVTNDGYEKIIKPSALVYFNPKNNPANRVFLRLSSWSFLEHSERNFFQVQVGYTIGIGTAIKSFGNKEPQAVANRAPSSPIN